MKTYQRSDQLTRDYLDSLLVCPRYINSIKASTKVSYFGHTYDSPIMTSTLSKLEKVYEGGNVALMKAARDTNTLGFNGILSKEDGLKILEDGTNAVLSWKPIADHGFIKDVIQLYEANGARAFVLDVDFIFDSETGSYRNNAMFGQMGPITSNDLKEFVSCSQLPIIIKGVLSTEDAVACLEAGVKGLVLSHHMGILDSAIPPIYVLPSIREVVGNEMTIFVDCGIQSGLDAFKALALGADGVLVGRPLMNALKEGPDKVTELLQQYTAQLKYYMSITGAKDISMIDPMCIIEKDF